MKLLREAAAFGRDLVRTGDLDPLYIALVRTFPREDRGRNPVLQRWVVAYSMFYHAGVACELASREYPPRFWNGASQGVLERWPHGAERRHFRGWKALNAVQRMASCAPEQIFAGWLGPAGSDVRFGDYAARIRATPQYGPWITFKLVDIFERVCGFPVDFPSDPGEALKTVYAEPAKAAALINRGLPLPDVEYKTNVAELTVVSGELLAELKDLAAPPGNDRPLGIQEIETILCKFKSACNGHYHVGKDIAEIRHALEWGGLSHEAKRLADEMRRGLPRLVDRKSDQFSNLNA